MKKIFLFILFGLLVISTILNLLFLIGLFGDTSTEWLRVGFIIIMLVLVVYNLIPPRKETVFDILNLQGHREWLYVGLYIAWIITFAIVIFR
jgi:hypothetical protein